MIPSIRIVLNKDSDSPSKKPESRFLFSPLPSNLPDIPVLGNLPPNSAGHFKDDLAQRTYKSAQPAGEIISGFLQRPSYLASSDAIQKNFSLQNSVMKLSKGIYLSYYSFHSSSRKEAFVMLRGESLFIDTHKIPVKDLKGFLLGASSSNFLRHKPIVEESSVTRYENEECFSVFTAHRSFDLSTKSAKKRYYFVVAMSWLIHAKSKSSGVVPLSKFNIALHTVRSKLREMATEANVRPNELLILAIIKHLRSRNDIENEIKVRKLFLKRFSSGRRLFNICCCLLKVNNQKRSLKEEQRIAMLNSKRINQLEMLKQNKKMMQTPKKGLTKKQTKILSYLVPSVKSIFQSKRYEHSTVIEFRRQLTNSSVNNSD